MKNFKTLIFVGAAMVSMQMVQAETEAPQYSREDMEAIIADQEQRVQSMQTAFLKAHEETEASMLKVVEYVSKLEDSSDSKTRVARLKKMIMSDLQTSIKNLQNQRRAAMQDLARLPEDYKEGSSQQAQIDLTEEMMNERVVAIMKMADSLHQHQSVPKYENYVKSSYNDEVKVKRRVSQEYKRDNKQQQNADQTRKELFENLDRVKFNLNNEIGYMEAEQKRAAGTELATQYEDEIAYKKEMLSLLEEHIVDLKTGSGTPTESVGSLNDAMQLEKDVAEAINQYKMSTNKLRQQGMILKQQIDLLNAQKVTLERTLKE
ncbi:hypothetical protein P0Y35_06490 [Kiritimatiellaeota bacterium B1221]|nr:hypothetical protein [Kiritimatiellaeota bacterium B1221]